MDKSIDFDRVADLYDVYVQADFDVPFWKDEARQAEGDVLELMCGSGRIGLPLVEAGVPYAGLDYSRRLLDRFESKLVTRRKGARLIHADARSFDAGQLFRLVFIGFHSLSEVLDNDDKLRVLQGAALHLTPGGRLAFSLHHSVVRGPSFTGQWSEPKTFEYESGKRTLEFRWRVDPPSPAGLVSGKQVYVVRDGTGEVIEQRELPIAFHLISREEIESLIAKSGLRIENRWGDYDRSAFSAASPYLIYRLGLGDI